MQFIKKFRECLTEKQTFLCIGIDPDPNKLPAGFSANADGVYYFVKEILAATSAYTPAYKFNLAFFEMWGSRGWQMLEKLLSEVPQNILLIGDAKRGDIGNSAKFYAKALFEALPFHAVTLSPYLGTESILPFIADESYGAFILCVTSNPSGREIQDFGGDQPLYLKVATIVQQLNQHQNLGLVMGATKPEQLLSVRQKYPELPFLIPGVGAQGGEIEAAVQVCQICGVGLINVSRAVLFPDKGKFPENVAEMAAYYRRKFKF
ncbi:MAG TPA: orotidine-5'-phosphate decarboxylase [Candidatus Marinimicrobia bacterium]|nr:orotidine-5'-phosphate decarboxylase [Candidatus Neomarinimicrobiota bacterium]HRS52139.1 orotidine-5'-phosphate decarboxylase [Candidatus Neomarinimicrobiota bacterium]HRU92484.1 orotidine-5'-phosphate decarboxylase [Candidatus Neomarinimicrobiota bacterium]